MFDRVFECSIGPLCAFIGGVVAQEIVKAITGKFMPIKQEMYLDIMELVPEELEPPKPAQKTRYSSLEKFFGEQFV